MPAGCHQARDRDAMRSRGVGGAAFTLETSPLPKKTMPEGPSIVILREQVAAFSGRKVLRVEGNSKLDLSRMQGRRVVAFRSWGKHFLICFDGFAMRVHFL